MPIHDWPENERPREKLLSKGATALSEAELLAILLRVGIVGKNAVELARDLLLRFGNLRRLFAASAVELSTVPGIGQAKFVQFQAALELARRVLTEEINECGVLASPSAVRDFLRLRLQALDREVFCCLFLDTQHRVLGVEDLFVGTLTQTSVYPREVVKRALQINAAAVIFAHNHPSGIAEASHSDRLLTNRLREALELVDIKVLDHVIVAGNHAISFTERGWL